MDNYTLQGRVTNHRWDDPRSNESYACDHVCRRKVCVIGSMAAWQTVRGARNTFRDNHVNQLYL